MLQRSLVQKDVDAQELLLRYAEYQDSWQEVVLLLENTLSASRGVIINRPLATRIDTDLASRLLYGAYPRAELRYVEFTRDISTNTHARSHAHMHIHLYSLAYIFVSPNPHSVAHFCFPVSLS